jgi:hypothetical protein
MTRITESADQAGSDAAVKTGDIGMKNESA